jgi:hypothetical protein
MLKKVMPGANSNGGGANSALGHRNMKIATLITLTPGRRVLASSEMHIWGHLQAATQCPRSCPVNSTLNDRQKPLVLAKEPDLAPRRHAPSP